MRKRRNQVSAVERRFGSSGRPLHHRRAAPELNLECGPGSGGTKFHVRRGFAGAHRGSSHSSSHPESSHGRETAPARLRTLRVSGSSLAWPFGAGASSSATPLLLGSVYPSAYGRPRRPGSGVARASLQIDPAADLRRFAPPRPAALELRLGGSRGRCHAHPDRPRARADRRARPAGLAQSHDVRGGSVDDGGAQLGACRRPGASVHAGDVDLLFVGLVRDQPAGHRRSCPSCCSPSPSVIAPATMSIAATASRKSWHWESGWTAATLVAFLVLFAWGAVALSADLRRSGAAERPPDLRRRQAVDVEGAASRAASARSTSCTSRSAVRCGW